MASPTPNLQIPSHLHTARPTLTLFSRSNPAHFTCMLACLNNPTAHSLMGDFGIRIPSQLDALNLSCRLRAFPDIDLIYMMSLNAAPEELIGAVTLGQRTRDLAPDIGWVLREGWMWRGFATEAAGEFLRVLMRDEIGIKDICTWPNEGNGKSNRVAEKLGFVDGGRVASRDEGGKLVPIWILPGMERVKEGMEIGFWGDER